MRGAAAAGKVVLRLHLAPAPVAAPGVARIPYATPMERPRLSRLEKACYRSLLSMTEGGWRHFIRSSDPYGQRVDYGREPARPGESEGELLELLGL